MSNSDIRAEIEKRGLRYHAVAHEIGIASSTLSVWLRYELDPERRQKVKEAIRRLAK